MEVSPSMRDPQVAVIVLLNCTKFMDTLDVIRASQVSRLWYSVISRKINWRTIKIKSCSTSNMKQLARVAKEKGSRTLDMQGNSPIRETMKNYWYKLFCEIQTVDSLTELKLGNCGTVVFTLFQKVSLGKTLNSLSMRLTSGLCYMTPEIFKTSLNSLVNLKKLCLNVNSFNCDGDTKKVLNAVAGLEMLRELELINFIVTEEFPSYLSKCTRLKKFSITPILRGLSYQIVIDGVVSIENTLTSFTLGVYRGNLLLYGDIQIPESRGRGYLYGVRQCGPPPARTIHCACLHRLNYFETYMRIYNWSELLKMLSNCLPNMKKNIVIL